MKKNEKHNGECRDYAYTLKQLAEAAGIKIGVAVTYSEYQIPTVQSIIHTEFDNVTFGNEMKNASVVRSDGSMDYSIADRLTSEMKAGNIDIFGHVLGWHSQQQSAYYNSLVSGATESHVGLKAFVNFEDGIVLNSWGTGSVFITENPKDVFVGDYSMGVVSTASGNPWDLQFQLPVPNTSVGEELALTFWMKAAYPGGRMRISTADSQYSEDYEITTSWVQYTYTFTPTGNTESYYLHFDMGYVENTYYIDNIRVAYPAEASGSNGVSVLGDYGTFEILNEAGTFFEGWSIFNGADYISIGTEHVHSGNYSLKINNTAGVSSNWDIQPATPVVHTQSNIEYTVSIWVYTPDNGAFFQFDVRYYDVNGQSAGSTTYSPHLYPIPGVWTKVSAVFTTPPATDRIQLTILGGGAAGTFYFDDMTIIPTADVGDRNDFMKSESAADRIDFALKTWVFNMVERYGTDVYAWDAVNELFTDGGGDFRTNNQELVDGVFYWGDWLGGTDVFMHKVFKYAKAMQEDAMLFINDFNLESSTAKLNAFCEFVKVNSDIIDGVGTQMHMSIITDKASIDNMFVQLSATGKPVRISELDIQANPDLSSTVFTEAMAKAQAEMYAYVVKSYFSNVPASQRFGITLWGTKDDLSWLTNHTGAEQWPLLFDAYGNRKEAYYAFYEALMVQTDLKTIDG